MQDEGGFIAQSNAELTAELFWHSLAIPVQSIS